MARVCDITGKRPMSGNNVPHSKKKTKRRFLPNLHTKRFFVPETGKWVTLKIAASEIRTIDKKGIYQYLKDAEAKYGVTVKW